MGWLSGNTDKTQDQRLKQLEETLAHIVKNQNILISNNNGWVKEIPKLSQAVAVMQPKIVDLMAKDKEHDALIQGIKTMAKSVEQAEATTE